MRRYIYVGMKEQGFSSRLKYDKPVVASSVADELGLVIMTSTKAGVSVSWGEVALRVVEAAKGSPELKADLLRALSEI